MVKTVEEIYQEMLSAYGEKTGVAPAEGCDLSARLYACAAGTIGTGNGENDWSGQHDDKMIDD